MAVGYLLGNDYVSPMTITYPDGTRVQNGIVWDVHGANQLEGELRRHWVREKKLPPAVTASIPLDRKVLDLYTRTYGLAYIEDKLARKIGLQR